MSQGMFTPQPIFRGVIRKGGLLYIDTVLCGDDEKGIVLFCSKDGHQIRIPFPEKFLNGNRCTLILDLAFVNGEIQEEYLLFAGSTMVTDRYAYAVQENGRCRMLCNEFKKQSFPQFKPSESIFYLLHMRGFTMDPSSQVKGCGTYYGFMQKISYLKKLGVNTIEAMPCNSFETLERVMPSGRERINYWGYKEGYLGAPNKWYTYGRDEILEFQSMIHQLHLQGMRFIMQLFISLHTPLEYILSAVQRWHLEYGVDGFHLKGSDIPYDMLLTDASLRDAWFVIDGSQEEIVTKYSLIQSQTCNTGGINTNCIYHTDQYMLDMRRLLLGKQNSITNLLHYHRYEDGDFDTMHSITNYYGFTLRDLFTYQDKHNLPNGEDNLDGPLVNESWNCGVEGESSLRSIQNLRKRQMQNAFALLLLSPGIPLILAGDEFGRTQLGNTNPYCLDDPTNWLSWDLRKGKYRYLHRFVAELISLRKEYAFILNKKSYTLMQQGGQYPDLSYHGEKAWMPAMGPSVLHIGQLYYEKKDEKEYFLYICYNFHWEPKEFSLIRLREGVEFAVRLSTCEQKEVKFTKQALILPARCVCVLTAIQ